MKKKRRVLSFFMAVVLFFTMQSMPGMINTLHAAEKGSHWYSQKGWTYNGKTLSSLCYITSYAMILHSMGFDVDPVDVYVANGCSNYANHTKIANAYGVDATSETGSLASMSTEEKKAFVKKLIGKYPQGIIVGGNYGSGTHYIVAKKVENDTIYFDDPAYSSESEGCCITISKVYKLTWSNISVYRVIKSKGATATPKVTATPKPTQTVAASATPKPTATVKPTASATATPKPTETVKPTASTTATPKPTASATATPKPTATVSPTANNPLGKYKVPTRTIYYKSSVMTGEDVKWVELGLKTLGYGTAVNGKYTKTDRSAVMKYQKKVGLSQDGYVGKTTRKKMISDLQIALTKVEKVAGVKVTHNGVNALSTSTSSGEYQATISWKKLGNVNGYVILYATNKNFSKPTKISKTENKVTIKKLKKNKTYYVKVRAYKKVNGTKVYGSYSSVKKWKV